MADGSLDTGTSQTHQRSGWCHEQSVENPGAIREIGYKDEWQLAIIFNHGSIAESSDSQAAGEIWNFVIFWFWIFGLGGCYLWHLVGFVLRLGVRQENCYLGTFYNLWPHSHWGSRSEVSGTERAWDSCDRDEILRTQQQPSSQNMAPCKYFIQPLENWNIGSVRDASASVYLCNSYQLSEEHHHQGISPCLTCLQLSSAQGRNVTDSWYISSLKSVFARSWSVSKQTSLIPQIL